jgi:hypothetical protein
MAEEEEQQKVWRQRNLSKVGRQRRDRLYPIRSVRMYSESPFKYLYDSKNDQALLNATGVDHREFSRLVSVFGPIFERYTYNQMEYDRRKEDKREEEQRRREEQERVRQERLEQQQLQFQQMFIMIMAKSMNTEDKQTGS